MPGFAIKDADLEQSKALPAAPGSIYTTAFDLGAGIPNAEFLADAEFTIAAPALTVVQLPNGETATYKVQDSTDNVTFVTVADAVLVQTGAGGAGAAAANGRARLPSDVSRYVRLAVTISGGAGDCSAASATARIVT